MNTEHLKDSPEGWSESLAALRALSDEVNAGLLALSRNDLEKFEAHVAAQQRICDSLRASHWFQPENLRSMVADLHKASILASAQATHGNAPAEKLLAIHKELAHLNGVYAALVVRAQNFFRILLSLRPGERQAYSREGKAVTPDHTWSCEV